MASSIRLFQRSIRAASFCHFWQSLFVYSSNCLNLPLLAISLPLPAISLSLFRQLSLFASFGTLYLSFFPATSVCLFRGSIVGFLLLQCSSGIVRHPRDLQESVAARFCRVLIFASSQYLSVIYLFHVMIH